MITRAEDGSEQGWAVCGTRQTCAVADHDCASGAGRGLKSKDKDTRGETINEIKEVGYHLGPGMPAA